MKPLQNIIEKPFHSIVLFDRSGSMAAYSDTIYTQFHKMEKTETFYKSYSLLSFNTATNIECEEQDRNTFYNKVYNLKFEGGTNIAQAITKANEYIKNFAKLHQVSIIIFEVWTDNEHNEGVFIKEDLQKDSIKRDEEIENNKCIRSIFRADVKSVNLEELKVALNMKDEDYSTNEFANLLNQKT